MGNMRENNKKKRVDDKVLLQLAAKLGYNTTKLMYQQVRKNMVVEIVSGSKRYFKVIDDGIGFFGRTRSGFDALVVQEVDVKRQVLSFPIMIIEGSNTMNLHSKKGPNKRPSDVHYTHKSLSLGKLPQSYADAGIYYTMLKKRGIEIKQVTGNSLGGGHAIYLGLLYPQLYVIALNPAPVPDVALKNMQSNWTNITVVKTTSDPLSLINMLTGLKTPGREVEISTKSVSIASNFVIVQSESGKYEVLNTSEVKKYVWKLFDIQSMMQYNTLSEKYRRVVDLSVKQKTEQFGSPIWYAHLGFSSQNMKDAMPQDVSAIAGFSMLNGKLLCQEKHVDTMNVDIGSKELLRIADSLKNDQFKKAMTIKSVVKSANELLLAKQLDEAEEEKRLREKYLKMIYSHFGITTLMKQVDVLKKQLKKAKMFIVSTEYIIDWILKDRKKLIQVIRAVEAVVKKTETFIQKSITQIEQLIDEHMMMFDHQQDILIDAVTGCYAAIEQSVHLVEANLYAFSNVVIDRLEQTKQERCFSEGALKALRIDSSRSDAHQQMYVTFDMLNDAEIKKRAAILTQKQQLMSAHFYKLSKIIIQMVQEISHDIYHVLSKTSFILKDLQSHFRTGRENVLLNTFHPGQLIDEGLKSIQKIKKLVRHMHSNIDHVVQKLKSTLLVALLGDETFAKATILQQYGIDVLGGMMSTFAEIECVLQKQAQKDVRELQKNVRDVRRSLESLHKQLKILLIIDA